MTYNENDFKFKPLSPEELEAIDKDSKPLKPTKEPKDSMQKKAKGGISKMEEIESGGKKEATEDYQYGHDTEMFDKLETEADDEKLFNLAKGGMSVEDYAHAQKNPHAKKEYSDGGEIHITKGHDYIKDLIK